MDEKNSNLNSFNTIKDVELQEALAPDKTDNRINPTQTVASGVDTRSGNITISDEKRRRIIIGQLPDKSYGMVISKDGYDVIDLFG